MTVLDDLDHEVRCDQKDCEGRAAFRLISPCCGHLWLACEECRDLDESARALMEMMGVLLRCVQCDGNLKKDMHWVALP